MRKHGKCRSAAIGWTSLFAFLVSHGVMILEWTLLSFTAAGDLLRILH